MGDYDKALHFVWVVNPDGTLFRLYGYDDPHSADQMFTGLCNEFGFQPSETAYLQGFAKTTDGSLVCFRHSAEGLPANQYGFEGCFWPPGD